MNFQQDDLFNVFENYYLNEYNNFQIKPKIDNSDKIQKIKNQKDEIQKEIDDKQKLILKLDEDIKKLQYEGMYESKHIEKLTKEKYDAISKLKYNYTNKMLKLQYPEYALNNNDNFITMKIDFLTQILEPVIESFGYKETENLPFEVNILDDSLVFDFIHFDSLADKINNTNNRYFAQEMIFHSQIKDSGHSVLIVFDKYLLTSYIIDSNGSLNYFDESFHEIKISEVLKNGLSQYCNYIGYNFITLNDINIDLRLNEMIFSDKQSDFFRGYCRPWTYYIQNIIIQNRFDPSFNLIEKLKELNKQNLADLMEELEIFQNKFYDDIIKANPGVDFKCKCPNCKTN